MKNDETKVLVETSEERRREHVHELLQDSAVRAAVQRDQRKEAEQAEHRRKVA